MESNSAKFEPHQFVHDVLMFLPFSATGNSSTIEPAPSLNVGQQTSPTTTTTKSRQQNLFISSFSQTDGDLPAPIVVDPTKPPAPNADDDDVFRRDRDEMTAASVAAAATSPRTMISLMDTMDDCDGAVGGSTAIGAIDDDVFASLSDGSSMYQTFEEVYELKVNIQIRELYINS